MTRARPFAVAAMLLASLLGTAATCAAELLRSYVARDRDHHASDGYELDNASANGAAGPRQLA